MIRRDSKFNGAIKANHNIRRNKKSDLRGDSATKGKSII